MNDIRRTILWVIFGFSMVLLWDKWQIHNGHQPTFFPSAQAPAPVAAPGSAPGPDAAQAPVSANAAAAVPGTPAAPPAAVPAASRERFSVTSDVLHLTFDTEGGSLVGAELQAFVDQANPDKKFVLLDESKDRVYLAQTGLYGGKFPSHKTTMAVAPGPREMKDGDNELTVRFESPEVGGVRLIKTYTLRRGSYAIGVQHTVVNAGNETVTPQVYLQLVRDGNNPPGESSLYSTYTGPAVYTSEKKFQKVHFEDIKKKKTDFVAEANDGYIAMVQHYFATAWLVPEGIKRTFSMDAVDLGFPLADCCYRSTMVASLPALAPGASESLDAKLYVGPQIENQLEALAPGLDLVKDYGWLTILAKPLYWLLAKLHGYLHNWGWSIVALVLLIKLAFYWLTAKGYASMARMKAVNPRIAEMRERLKDKPQEMQQEMMRIYREEKINPIGGCFPMMIQIPVFIALYWVLLSTVEMRGAPWVLWIKDLSSPDPLFILPVLMTLSSLLQTWLNPTPPDPMQAKLMWFMPLAFSVMFFFFPSGLVLYWLTNNILSIAQQWVINKRLGVLGK